MESFFFDHQHTIAAIEAGGAWLAAIGTISAVIVSLWLSRDAIRPKLRAYVDLGYIIHSTVNPDNPPTYLVVDITNIGAITFRVSLQFLIWKIPFQYQKWIKFTPLDYTSQDSFIAQKKYPYKVEPKCSEVFYISDKDTLHSNICEFVKNTRWFPVLRLRFIRMKVQTDDGTVFTAQASPKLRQQIHEIVKNLCCKTRGT